MDWTVRKADLSNVDRIVQLSRDSSDVLMPYTLSRLTTKGYIDQFLVAYLDTTDSIGGAVHFVPNDVTLFPDIDRVVCFLELIKQVPVDIVDNFMGQYISTGRNGRAMIGQVICPGKGSFYAILEEAKKQFDEIWCYMSINGPSYKSYQRYGFDLDMDNVREFWNVYKCGYSKFVLGKWTKGGLTS